MKFCKRCNTDKDEKEFGVNNARRDKLTVWCTVCLNARKRELWQEYYANNKKSILKKEKDYRVNHPDKASKTWSKAGNKYRGNNQQKVKDSNKRYRSANTLKIEAAAKKDRERVVSTLADRYVKEIAIRQRKFTKAQIEQYPEIIQLIKLTIKGKRLCKSKIQNNLATN